MDMDTAYENRGFIPNGDAYPDKWDAAAQSWREVENAVGRARLNLPYGEGERQAMDIFLPAGPAKGLVFFIHGGYWRMFDRKTWSHLSAGAVARGWAVAMPSYTLAPDARIAEITLEMARALEVAAGKVSGPIVVAGHSAGGHLAARMMCEDVQLDAGVAERLVRCVPISPVVDLRPLLETKMNADFQLDMAAAEAESPVLKTDVRDVPVTVWVGAEERPVFLDQARWLADAWETADLHMAPGRHHFDVIEELEEPYGPLTNALLNGF